ncbi:MAG: hypothetical protein KDD50_01905 [Bdellovibrionales bacterium]|nr:hypothetical protein [Bdellovibrionales bacterium]
MENEKELADIIRAIKEDEDLSDLLLSVLDLDKEQRILALQKLAREIERDGAPIYLIEAILSLQNHSLAKSVQEVLTN